MTTPNPSNSAEYMVRFVMRVVAKPDAPQSAVLNFIEMIVQNGLRDWVFRVEDSQDGSVLGYFDGYGDPVDMTPDPATEESVIVTSPATPEGTDHAAKSDDSLIALAESLNAESVPGEQEGE